MAQVSVYPWAAIAVHRLVHVDRHAAFRSVRERPNKKAGEQSDELTDEFPLDEMFKTACGLREIGGWEIAPSEFWRMTPSEWWLIYDMNVGDRIKAKADTMNDLKRLYFKSKEDSA